MSFASSSIQKSENENIDNEKRVFTLSTVRLLFNFAGRLEFILFFYCSLKAWITDMSHNM